MEHGASPRSCFFLRQSLSRLQVHVPEPRPGPARQRAFCAREPGRERVAGTARGAALSAPVVECLASAPCGRRLRYLRSISIAAEPVKITSASQTSVRTIWLRPLFQGSV